jgi:PEP-CTERM motif
LNDPVVEKIVRKRRSWYRRELRVRRTLLTTVVVLLLAAVSWQSVARQLSLPRLHVSQVLPDAFWERGDVRAKLAQATVRTAAPRPMSSRSTYPYSVIPGGIQSVAELREQAARDYVVRRHYANFEYRFARIIQAHVAREVYLSYRLGDRVFWTKKKVHLRPGEQLITDGNITARTRCGNQISEKPKAEVSDEEPSEDVLDQPVAWFDPMPNLPFRAALAPQLPGSDISAPGAPHLFGGGFVFPYVSLGPPSGLCTPQSHNKKCHPKRKPPVAPEPGSMLLIGTGLVAVFWGYQRSHRGRKEMLAEQAEPTTLAGE